MARISGYIAGVLTLLVAFIYKIPIFPEENFFIDLKIFTIYNVDYYIWGYFSSNISFFSPITQRFPENIIALSIWIIIFLIGLISIMASTKDAKYGHSLKLYRINLILIILILSIYGIIALLLHSGNFFRLFYPFLEVLGLGYYLLILSFILNIIALKKLKK